MHNLTQVSNINNESLHHSGSLINIYNLPGQARLCYSRSNGLSKGSCNFSLSCNCKQHQDQPVVIWRQISKTKLAWIDKDHILIKYIASRFSHDRLSLAKKILHVN